MLTWNGCAHKRNNRMFPGQRQAPSSPKDANRSSPPSRQPLRTPKGQQLALTQMVYRHHIWTEENSVRHSLPAAIPDEAGQDRDCTIMHACCSTREFDAGQRGISWIGPIHTHLPRPGLPTSQSPCASTGKSSPPLYPAPGRSQRCPPGSRLEQRPAPSPSAPASACTLHTVQQTLLAWWACTIQKCRNSARCESVHQTKGHGKSPAGMQPAQA